jgi:nicotinate dehydrogenase subunit A
MAPLNLNVNGKNCKVAADPASTLLSVLREELRLTGAKPGCGEGQCGACTVLVAGKAVRSCVTPANTIGTNPVQTIEGLSASSKPSRIQQSFLDHSAFQCGYCTPGMIMAAVGLLNRIPNPTVEDIRTELNGNLCRCGTYPRVIKAILHAAQGWERA